MDTFKRIFQVRKSLSLVTDLWVGELSQVKKKIIYVKFNLTRKLIRIWFKSGSNSKKFQTLRSLWFGTVSFAQLSFKKNYRLVCIASKLPYFLFFFRNSKAIYKSPYYIKNFLVTTFFKKEKNIFDFSLLYWFFFFFLFLINWC